MFPTRMFPRRFFTPRYWPRRETPVGPPPVVTVVTVPGAFRPDRTVDGGWFPAATVRGRFAATASVPWEGYGVSTAVKLRRGAALSLRVEVDPATVPVEGILGLGWTVALQVRLPNEGDVAFTVDCNLEAGPGGSFAVADLTSPQTATLTAVEYEATYWRTDLGPGHEYELQTVRLSMWGWPRAA